ncbi:hypothetical protein NDU88_003420 [Pleurodeles waltl]|uniref:Uncharacterized protein n=1 Tax=Pleurodeles waltl TaxID=8319 RepID=A0AAV7UYD8_PLEWA|nr:hypothetical protein NDU88_003420 [Pleurodeles waltl]
MTDAAGGRPLITGFRAGPAPLPEGGRSYFRARSYKSNKSTNLKSKKERAALLRKLRNFDSASEADSEH